MQWRASLGAMGLALALTACGGLPGSSPEPTVAPTLPPPTAPAATRSPVPSTATPAPKPTNAPESQASSDSVWVGNTDGEGVYVRKTPVMADRLQAYPDGTQLTIIGEDVEGDDQTWKHIKTPDGLEGYVPSTYTLDAPP